MDVPLKAIISLTAFSLVLTPNNYIMKKIPNLKIACKTFLFICCFVFVTIRGYRSFTKFFEKQEAVDVSFQFIGGLTFPLISYCVYNNPWIKFNSDIFDDCNLTASDYQTNGKWSGTGKGTAE